MMVIINSQKGLMTEEYLEESTNCCSNPFKKDGGKKNKIMRIEQELSVGGSGWKMKD